MNQNRLFQAVIGLALVVVAGLTARQAVLTAQVVSAAGVTETAGSLQAAYSPQGGGWVTETDGHAAGVDGGLLALSGSGAARTTNTCPFTAVEQRALRAAYRAQGGGWVTQNGARAAGMDGGLLALRGCGAKASGAPAQVVNASAQQPRPAALPAHTCGLVTYTGTHPAGVDGGLLSLLTCRQ